MCIVSPLLWVHVTFKRHCSIALFSILWLLSSFNSAFFSGPCRAWYRFSANGWTVKKSRSPPRPHPQALWLVMSICTKQKHHSESQEVLWMRSGVVLVAGYTDSQMSVGPHFHSAGSMTFVATVFWTGLKNWALKKKKKKNWHWLPSMKQALNSEGGGKGGRGGGGGGSCTGGDSGGGSNT